MKSFAKINIFLKIVGTRANYHELISRFILVDEIYDEIWFEKSEKFKLVCDSVDIKDNIVLKAKKALEDAGFKNELDEFFSSHKIVLKKNIPMGAGLGGGSSNAAAFLNLANSELNLKISKERLYKIAESIGADVAFFVSGFKSANVSGIGEIVKEFDDEIPKIKIFTPDVFCSTPEVYKEFRRNFMDKIDTNLANKMQHIKSSELLATYKNDVLNDLYAPCFKIYNDMKEYKDMFLSGSGSTVFKVINGQRFSKK